jgi:hypothetical protein
VGRKRRKKSERARDGGSRVLELRLARVEVARGYDGPLRGAPELALVFGVYRIHGDDIALVSRRVIRLEARGEFPERVEVQDGKLEARLPRVDEMRVLVLATALEEDDRRGIEQVYADLEAPQQLAAWRVDAAVPDPVSLIDWARATPEDAPRAARVHLVDAAGDLRDRELGDDWVGAALFHLGSERQPRQERRLRFVSADGKNDWTAVLELKLL